MSPEDIFLDRHCKFVAQYKPTANVEFFKGHYFKNQKIIEFCIGNSSLFEVGLKTTGVGIKGENLSRYFVLSPQGLDLTSVSKMGTNDCLDYRSWLSYAMNKEEELTPMEAIVTFRILMRFLVSETYGICFLQKIKPTSDTDLLRQTRELTLIESHICKCLKQIASKVRLIKLDPSRENIKNANILSDVYTLLKIHKDHIFNHASYFSNIEFRGIYADQSKPNPLLTYPICVALLDSALFSSNTKLALKSSYPNVTVEHLNLYVDTPRSVVMMALDTFRHHLRFNFGTMDHIPVSKPIICLELFLKIRNFLRSYEKINIILERFEEKCLLIERTISKKYLDELCKNTASEYNRLFFSILNGPANCFYNIDKSKLSETSYKLHMLSTYKDFDSIFFVETFVPYVAQVVRLTRVHRAPPLCTFTSRISEFDVKSVFPHILHDGASSNQISI